MHGERPPIHAFIHIFKTGGTTLTGILRRNFTIRHFDTRLFRNRSPVEAADLRRIRWIYPNLVSMAGHAVRPFTDLDTQYPNVKFYTFLRQPRSRIFSAFRFTTANMVRDGGWRPANSDEIGKVLAEIIEIRANEMCAALAPEGRAQPAIQMVDEKIGFVGLVEAFDESLIYLREWMGNPDFDIRYQKMNVSGDRSGKFKRSEIQPFLDRLDDFVRDAMSRQTTLDLVAETNRDDQALYDHAVQHFDALRKEGRLHLPASTMTLEDRRLNSDTLGAKAHRLVGKLLVPVLVK